MLRVEPHKVGERFLTGIIGRTSGGCETVPEVEGSVPGEVSVRFIPVVRGFSEEG